MATPTITPSSALLFEVSSVNWSEIAEAVETPVPWVDSFITGSFATYHGLASVNIWLSLYWISIGPKSNRIGVTYTSLWISKWLGPS
jgi:hypothetical protein